MKNLTWFLEGYVMRHTLMCVMVAGVVLTGTVRGGSSQERLTALYDSLSHPVLDENAISEITNVSILRGGQSINFSSGTIRFFAPVYGHVRGAVFLGTGRYIVSPPTEIERMEFERQTGNKLDSGIYRYEFQRAVLWFTDSVYEEIRPYCRFKGAGVQRPERDAVNRSLQYVTNTWNTNGLLRSAQEILEPHPESYLLAHVILDREGTDLFLDYDVRRYEEVVISHPSVGYSGGYSFSRSSLCSFHLPQEYGSASEFDLSQEDKRPISVLDTKIDLTFEKREKMTLTSELHFKPVGVAPASVIFYLYPEFKLKSITGVSGEKMSFIREDKSWEILVMLPKQDSLEYRLTFQYEGEFNLFGYIADIFPPDGWYPETGYLSRMNFDLTYRIPKELTVVSAGWKTSETLDKDVRIVKYRTKDPTLLVSFSMGEFNMDSLREFSDEPLVKGYYFVGGDTKSALHDIANSIHLFTNLFGKISYDEFSAVNGPWGNGQSFQQFIHLPTIKENVEEGNFSVSLGRAHEISHAWWGHAVGWRSYHDQWLSEGFAHYSALLHALFVLRQDEPFFEKLRDWRKEIVGIRKYAFGSGPAAGSIWLGYRSASIKTREDPTLLIYKKGAWVLHMLRMLMMDLQSFKEDAFKAMMKDYYASFNGMDPGTTDFQHIVEKYMRMDMTWFFHQWVYRNEIPTYNVRHTITRNAAGKWVVEVSVKETGVPESFKMFVPIEIKLKNGNSAFTRLFIDQPLKTFSYELDAEPEKLLFNKFESVLCSVEE